MARRLSCKSCGKMVWIKSSTYRQKYSESSIQDEDTFKHDYVCGHCRALEYSMNIKNRTLRETEPYKVVCGYCHKCYMRAVSKRLTPDAINEMRLNIHNKLREYNIIDYEYIVYMDVVRGIRIKNVPFFGTVEMKLC